MLVVHSTLLRRRLAIGTLLLSILSLRRTIWVRSLLELARRVAVVICVSLRRRRAVMRLLVRYSGIVAVGVGRWWALGISGRCASWGVKLLRCHCAVLVECADQIRMSGLLR